MYSCGPLHMDEQRQDDQLEPICSGSVPILNVALKTCRKQLTIEKGGKWGSGISVLMAQHNDDDFLVDSFSFPCYFLLYCFFLLSFIRLSLFYSLSVCLSVCLSLNLSIYPILSLRVFGLLSSSLLLFPKHFGRNVITPITVTLCILMDP